MDSIIPQLIFNSIIASSIYALVAMGFNLIYGTTKFFNLAHGVVAAIGGYTVFFLSKKIGLELYFAIPVAIIFSGFVGWLTEVTIYRPLRRKKSSAMVMLVTIARGLISDPKILLLDESSLGLSPKIVKEVFVKIKEINEKRQTAIMIVEHNLHSVLAIVDRAYLLDKGRIVKEDEPHKMIESGILEKVFLGKA